MSFFAKHKHRLPIFISLGFLMCSLVGYALGPYFFGAWVAWRQPVVDSISMLPTAQAGASMMRGVTTSTTTLVISPEITFSVFAKNIPGARVIAEDELGNLWVSQTSEGTITRIELQNGMPVAQEVVVKNLKKPHGLAFDPIDPSILYIATEKELLRYQVYRPSSTPEKVLDFPTGGRHTTRTLLFARDGFLYISIGSTCNVCFEKSSFVAGVFRVDVRAPRPTLIPFARGLRNAVFMTEHPTDHRIVATEMGRDYLGNNFPPDEINILSEGGDYGWPLCYGNNVHDRVFDDKPVNPCYEPTTIPSYIDLPAHSAPLGLVYVPPAWKESWRGNLIVALHGSWNSTQPVGYSLVRLKIDAEGRYYGAETIVSGWQTARQTLGRPVDVVLDQSGEQMYVSDDKAGLIYVLRPQP